MLPQFQSNNLKVTTTRTTNRYGAPNGFAVTVETKSETKRFNLDTLTQVENCVQWHKENYEKQAA